MYDLIIRLTAGEADAVLIEIETLQQQAVNTELVNEIKQQYDKLRQLIVVLPADQVSVQYINLPNKLPRADRCQAAAFIIENHSMENSNNLFLIDLMPIGGKNHFAVMNKKWFYEKFTKLSPYYKKINVLFEPLILKHELTQWSAFIQDDTIIIRTQAYDGFTCKIENINVFLQHYAEHNNLPTMVMVYLEKWQPLSEMTAFDQYKIQVKYQRFSGNLFDLIYKNYREHFAKILPGKQINTLSKKINVKLLTTMVKLALVLLLAITTVNSIEIVYYHKVKQKLTGLNNKIYYYLYPNVKQIVSIKSRVSQEIKTLSTSIKNRSIYKLISDLDFLIRVNNGIAVHDLSYKNENISLKIIFKNKKALTSMKDYLNKKGYVFTIEDNNDKTKNLVFKIE